MALDEIEKGNLWGFISFPANFSQAMIERGIAGNLADNETLHSSRIRIKMDMSSNFQSNTKKFTFLINVL